MGAKYSKNDVFNLCAWFSTQDFRAEWLLSKFEIKFLIESIDCDRCKLAAARLGKIEIPCAEFYMLHRIVVLRALSQVFDPSIQVKTKSFHEFLALPLGPDIFMKMSIIDFLLFNNNYSGFCSIQEYLNSRLSIQICLSSCDEFGGRVTLKNNV